MNLKKNFITLGIESSCDETGIAVLRNGNELLSSVVASSLKIHQKFGGVVPEIASRHCLEYIQPVYEEALEKAGILPEEIDLIGVTYGPGLVGSLLVGFMFAKGLSYRLEKPLLGVNHLEAHLAVNYIEYEAPEKPFLGLIVSGGHTCLIHGIEGRFDRIGETRDDALGEAFDKVSKMLGLGYPGGPKIEKAALGGDENKWKFNCAKLPGTYDFSFSGVKTGVLYHVRDSQKITEEIPDICASFQKSVFDILIEKTLKAAQDLAVTQIVIGGGVSANQYFRKRIEAAAQPFGFEVLFPPIRFAIDNGAMIAKRAFDLFLEKKIPDPSLVVDPALQI